MANHEIHDKPADVTAEGGCVVLTCPNTVDVRMTPGAAEETSDRLLEGAMKARGQTYFADDKPD